MSYHNETGKEKLKIVKELLRMNEVFILERPKLIAIAVFLAVALVIMVLINNFSSVENV